MNCPQCDSLLYRNMCACGFKVPPVSTIEIKQMGAVKSNYPLQADTRTKEALSGVNLTGKAYAEYCIEYAKKILRGEIC